ncbi:MAG: metallophosphoesterase [Deltaproteobacteria bacterium]|jgi:predicted MPP superfamily phosphohydrolase|nr:metallophosphoesterase [Deltaproteobacteria bacterium]
MFLNFGLVLTFYVFLSYILRLPVARSLKLVLMVLTFASAARIWILRGIYGGLGGIECDKWLLYVTSFFQSLVIMLFLLSFFRDLAWLLSFLTGKSVGKAVRHALNGGAAALVMLGLAAVLDLAGLVGAAKVPEVRAREITVGAWPAALDGFKVAVLGDMHISKFFDAGWVGSAVDRTMAERPEMILLPGDMVDGSVEARRDDVAPLAGLSAPYGVWACVGNHEYISQLTEWLPVFQNLGLNILYNSHVLVAPRGVPLVVAGLADLTALGPRYNLPGPDLELALEGAPDEVPVVLLEHRPVRARMNAEDKRVALQLSGHTHGGMMPILSSAVKKMNGGFVTGEYQVGGLSLFVQPGLGLWAGFPVRLFSPSEITILTIRSAAGAGGRGRSG